VNQKTLDQGTPITVAGRTVGTVIDDAQPAPLAKNPAEELYVVRTNQALAVGAIGATILATILGLLLAVNLTRPLRELAQASHAMAEGELGRQVPVRSQDELGELATAFNRMSADLERSNILRKQMTADIAHELRTPLTVLSGYLEAMRDGDLAPTPPRLALMDQEVRTLKRLVTDLRTLTLADAGELSLHREAEAPAALLERVRAGYAHSADLVGVTLAVNADDGLPTVQVDPERMQQVLGNLVSNALRFTPANGRITLSAQAETGCVCFRVTDTGQGIAPQDLAHIFDRFYQGDKSRSQSEGESGLGLAIVKSLVEAHGGSIEVESEVGRGTSFNVRLPV
jgi:signal transduction histidine kinase